MGVLVGGGGGENKTEVDKDREKKAKGLVLLFRMFVIAYLSLLLEGIGQVTVGIREVQKERERKENKRKPKV